MINNDSTRILIIDDDEDDFILLRDYLNDLPDFKFVIEWIGNFEVAEKAIREHRHDLYFFDYLLGAQTGLDLLKKIAPVNAIAPVIFLTGKGDRRTDMEAMKLGAADYLVKTSINPENLERSIRYALERYQVSHALKSSEERYRNIFERSRDMIYLTDVLGNFVTVNDSASRIFGYTKEEFKHMNALDLYSNPEARVDFIEAINKSGVLTNYEVALKHKNGEVKHCIISGSVQRMGRENQIFYQGIIHDITRRKKAEKDLIIAEKLSVTGRLVRTLAHEVRNPLTNINLSVDQLEFETTNEELKIYFDIIKRNSKRINDLISELLQASRPQEINKKVNSVNDLAEETLALAIDRITLKNIKLLKNFTTSPCDATIDSSVMKIALLNIIINAVEAMKEGEGILTITTKKEDDRCYIIITDNGSGISKENLGRLFEPYFTGKTTGVGLGLATTHNIIQSHNGTIDVDSEVGIGTTFTITLQ